MKKTPLLNTLCGAMLLTAVTCFAGTDEDAAVRVVESFVAAIDQNKLESADALWVEDDSYSILDGGKAHYAGWKDFRVTDLAPEIAHMQGLRFDRRNIRPHVAGDVAWITYEWTATAQMEGKPMRWDGVSTAILRRIDRQWRIAHFHLSAKRP